MSNAEHQALKPLVDEYDNVHQMADELARGGQGVVYRTKDADLAVKQPLDAAGQPDKNANLRERFQHVRLLPIPRRIPVSLPLATRCSCGADPNKRFLCYWRRYPLHCHRKSNARRPNYLHRHPSNQAKEGT